MIIFFSTIFLYPFFWIYNYIFGWREFSEDEIKHWAKRKLNQKIFNYEKKTKHNAYNCVFYVYGKRYKYKAWCELIGQGVYKIHYYRKKRKHPKI